MISLITGLPGSGKTSLIVHMLMTRKDLQNRPLFVDGIPELKLPTMPIPDGESMETWHKWAPVGAIIVIDEAQRIFRPRPAGSKVPDYVHELETHRHKGLDFFILTQHPRLIDVNLRSLVGEHRNISRTMLGFKRVSYWQKCANPESRNDVADAKNSIFTTKKDAFGMYKSAEEHNKLKGSLTSWVWFLPLLIFLVVYLSFNLKSSLEKKTVQKKTVQQSDPVNQSNNQQVINNSSLPVQAASRIEQPITQYLSEKDFEPTIKGKPWTAPIYDGLNRNVQSMPFPVACVESVKAKKCTCYTDQATPMPEIDKKTCLDYARNGIFDPYSTPATNQYYTQRDDGTYTDN